VMRGRIRGAAVVAAPTANRPCRKRRNADRFNAISNPG
jgi:hypothetical protein